jgi:hypothetical protein
MSRRHATPQPRMTFKVNDLIKHVTDKRQQVERDHARDMKRYESRIAKIRQPVIVELEDMARAIKTGARDLDVITRGSRYSRETDDFILVLEIPSKIKLPDKPELDTSSLDYMLEALGKTTDETIKLTPLEAAYYLDKSQ